MKFLIFGGNGFVGNALVKHIELNGGEVLSLSRSGAKNSLAIDITQESDFEKINFHPGVIINCASQVPTLEKSSKDPEFLKELFLTNVIGAVNIANWAVKYSVPKIINCSTLVVVKKPWPSPLTEAYSSVPDGAHVGYSMSKLSQEKLMQQAVNGSNTTLLHLRFSAVYGTNMVPLGIIFSLLDKLNKNEEIKLFDADKNTFDFINVQDVIKIIFELSHQNFDNGIVNLASGKPMSLMQLVTLLKTITGSSSIIKNTDTLAQASTALISIEKLSGLLGQIDFMDIKEGLKLIVDNYKR